MTVCQKLGVILVIKWFKKLKSAKNAFYKKSAPKLIFFNEILFRKIQMIFCNVLTFGGRGRIIKTMFSHRPVGVASPRFDYGSDRKLEKTPKFEK